MMKIKAFLLLTIIVSAAFCLSSKPGARIRLRTDALNSAARSLIDELNAMGNNIQVPDQSTKWHMFHLEISSIVVKNLNIDRNQLSILTGRVSFHYKIKLGKHGPHKSGSCDASVDGSSAKIKFGISEQNSHPLLNLIDKSANINDLNYHCRGGWVSKLLNLFKHALKGFLKKEIKNFAEKDIGTLIPKMANKLLAIPIEHELRGKLDGTYVNYGLSSSPKLNNQMLNIPLIMQFWYKGHKNDNPATVYPSSQPFPTAVPPQMFCVDIDSNLAARSAIYAFNVSDKSTFTIGDSNFKRLSKDKQQFFDCSCVGNRCLIIDIPDLTKQCTKDKKFGIYGKVKVGGDIYVNNSGIILFADATFDFKLGNGIGQETGPSLLTVKADLDVLLEKTVHIQNWNLIGKFDVLFTSLSANSTFGPIAPHIINDIWNFVIKDIVELLANDALASGIPLPPLNFITFNNVHLHFDNPIIQTCSDVVFDFKKLLS
uniref:Lipid-binding serum glycoprotein C-terminal domain-containing protein n=1 Tax=Panagrolaimus davidi TaxID=227884 RepID=A0A914QNV2_9BILA